MGDADSVANVLVLNADDSIPAANAAEADGDVSIGMSQPSSYLSNHSKPRMFGKRVGRAPNLSLIHCAFDPPDSVDRPRR